MNEDGDSDYLKSIMRRDITGKPRIRRGNEIHHDSVITHPPIMAG